MSESASREILFVTGNLDVGGCERHLRQLLPMLAARGLRPVLYCLTHRGALADDLERDGVPVLAPSLHLPARMPVGLRRLLLLPVTVLSLFFLLLRRRPAAVHCFLSAAYLIGAPCALFARVPLRLMSRRSLNDYQKDSPVLTRVEQFLHPYMHRVLGNSQAVLAQLREEGVPEERLVLIYNGVNTYVYHPATEDERVRLRQQQLIRPNTLVLLVVANLIPYKGHADLLEALAGIANQLPDDWQLLLLGRDDGIGSNLMGQAEQLGIYNHVRLLGMRNEVADFMRMADIGILPSHQEGFSNTLLESMACGLPMVATAVGGNVEALEEGVNGFLVPPRDPQSLSKALLRLAWDPQLRERFGQAAHRRCVENFSLDTCVSAYHRLYLSQLPETN